MHIKQDFLARNHVLLLLDYRNIKFDRDYVDFNVRISELSMAKSRQDGTIRLHIVSSTQGLYLQMNV